MTRFGTSQLYDPQVRDDTFARLFLRVAGTVMTSSSHFHFMRTVKTLEKQRTFQRTLDAGCGKGKFSFWLAQRWRQTRVDACDLDGDKIEVCEDIRRQLDVDNVGFFVEDLTTLRAKEQYDFVFSNHVLEHIPDNALAIANLVGALKPGGYIYIQIPNAVQRRFAWGRRFVQGHEEWTEGEHGGQTFTLDTLAGELERLGCRVITRKFTEGWLGEVRFELEEMALSYFKSQLLFVLLYPLLKTMGYVDSRLHYSNGNGILVLAQKAS